MSKCSRAIDDLGPSENKNIETEARFGSTARGRFTPGVNRRQFDEVLQYFTKAGWSSSRTLDKISSRTLNPKQTVRKIETSNGSVVYQLKEKIKVIDVQGTNYRLAKSMERSSVVFTDVFNNANKNGEYVQTRDRMTFKKGTIQVDLTYLPESRGSQYQIEIEFIGKEEACKHIELVSELLDDVRVKGIVFSQYRDLLGNRFAGPLPQTLTKDAFDKRILTKNKYSVTEKADGERFLLFVDRLGGLNLISRGLDITRWKITNKPEYANTVLDGEYVGDYFYAFDILYLKGKDLRQQTLKPRLKALDSVNMGSNIKMKKFIVDENIYKAAGKIWEKKGNFPYELDGLIFTPVDEPYFNGNILKWKDDNTIDFYYNGKQLFIAGFDKAKTKYQVFPFEGVDGKGTFYTKSKEVTNDIFNDTNIPESIRKGFLPAPIPGPPMVGEFKFGDNTFKLIRKRPDKEFPNGIDASNQAWEAISKPVTIAMLRVGPGAMRDFHSEIKSKMIMKYAKGKSVLDIGSGKGEDVGKYVKANSKPVVGFDIVDEEYPHPNYMTFYKMNNPVYRIKNFIPKDQKFDVVNINFAIHYFLRNTKSFESLIVNIHENLKKGGVLMATVLDGRLVYEALKNKNKLVTNKVEFSKKYNDALNFNSPKFKLLGQEVEVMVKGTKYFNKPISEFLFNFEKFLKIMEQMGYELVEKGNFRDFCSESEWCREYMTEAEKDYSFKNIYFVLRKK